MVNVTKDNIINTVYRNFFDICNNNISSVTLDDDSTVSLQLKTGAFPDKDVNKNSDYPILVVNSPTLAASNLTFGKVTASGEILIEVFATSSQVADRFAGKIYNAIESNKNTLRDNGLKNVQYDTTENDFFNDRGGLRIHSRSLTFSWEFTFTKTERAY